MDLSSIVLSNGRNASHTQIPLSVSGYGAITLYEAHISIYLKNLPKYLGEFEYRYNMRKQPEIMFDRLLISF